MKDYKELSSWISKACRSVVQAIPTLYWEIFKDQYINIISSHENCGVITSTQADLLGIIVNSSLSE